MENIDRPLTEEERNWLLRGLKTLSTGGAMGGGNWVEVKTGEVKPLEAPLDPQFFLSQIDSLRVRGICTCGEPNCHTVTFQHAAPGKSSAIVCSHTEDNRMLIIHINEETGLLAELEIV